MTIDQPDEQKAGPPGNSGIAAQAAQGSLYSIGASIITLILGFTRSLLLARWVLPEHFGVVALVVFFIGLVNRFRGLGLDSAFMHNRHTDEPFMKTYFTFRTGLDLGAVVVLFLLIPLIRRAYPDLAHLEPVMVILTAAYFVSSASQFQEAILQKNLAFSSLNLLDIISSIVMTLVAPYLAWQGWGIWALVGETVSGFVTRFLLSWSVFRQWRPRFGWHKPTAVWFWNYGKPLWVATNLGYLLDTFDDFWTGTFLGERALGYYSKAYENARYPRRVVANPLGTVFSPVFARLQENRVQLSQAFYRSAYLIIRAGCLIAGVFALLMPEFIEFIIGVQWWPMLWPFRLMLIYTILEPFSLLIANLLIVTGQPAALQKVNLIQFLFFVPAVILGAWLWNIQGVALAANGMVIVGIILLYRPLKKMVDCSVRRLFLWPIIALGLAWAVGFWMELTLTVNVLQAITLKLSAFIIIFGGLLTIAERKDYVEGLRWFWQIILNRRKLK